MKRLFLLMAISLLFSACDSDARNAHTVASHEQNDVDVNVQIQPDVIGHDGSLDTIVGDLDTKPDEMHDGDNAGESNDKQPGALDDENYRIPDDLIHQIGDSDGEKAEQLKEHAEPEQPQEPEIVKEPEEQPVVSHEAYVIDGMDGLTNLYQVSDDLYRSAQPGANGLNSARELGIRTVLSLQLVSLDEGLENTDQSGLTLEHIPMVPWSVSSADLLEALSVIRDAEKPVLVHCLHGSDRTGIVVAFYRIIFQKWSIEDARAEMTSELFGYHSEFDNLLELFDSVDVEALRAEVSP